jgi:hypothetical protein
MGVSASDPTRTQSYYQVLSLISLIQHSFRPPRRHWHTAGRRGPPGRAGPPRASWPSMDSQSRTWAEGLQGWLSVTGSHASRGPGLQVARGFHCHCASHGAAELSLLTCCTAVP